MVVVAVTTTPAARDRPMRTCNSYLSYSVGAVTHSGRQRGFISPDPKLARECFEAWKDDPAVASVSLFGWLTDDCDELEFWEAA
jgi:hypothetical protein